MSLKGASIILVDDHRELAENLQEILMAEGASVKLAGDAREARELAVEIFDLALVDIGLPGTTGLALVPELKRSGDGLMEVLIITGSASIDSAIDSVKAGAYDYVLKPFDPAELVKSLQRALEQVRLRREAASLSLALHASERSLRTLVDTVQALLVVLDENGTVIMANRAVAELTGVNEQELAGRSWGEEFVSASDRASFQKAFCGLVTGSAEGYAQQTRISIPNDAGGRDHRWINWAAAAYHSATGELQVYLSGLDVTDMRMLEQKNRLTQKLAAVGTLAAGLAHEIRNPLNAAHLQLKVLERRARKVEDARLNEPVDLVQTEIARLSNLVSDFLAFARPAEIRPYEVDLGRLVSRLIELQGPTSQRLEVTLTTECDAPDRVTITADEQKLQQVLLNLIRNAQEAVGIGGKVCVQLIPLEHRVDVIVHDNGPGIPPEHLERVFEPFFSTKENGTGLGMAICHSLVTLHGGDLLIRCDEQKGGTEVVMSLPRSPPKVNYPALSYTE